MNKLYRKNEVLFAVAWIVAYVVLSSIADNLSRDIGPEKCVTLPLQLAMCAALFLWIRKNGLWAKYGLRAPDVPAARLLFYLPMAVIATCGVWQGFDAGLSPLSIAIVTACMLCVGFLEEVIFRGLLFRAMAKDNLKTAVVVSSVTFGIGHIVNLFNGSGRSVSGSLIQITFAIAVGFMLVMVFMRSGSLIPCIVFHGMNNVFASLGADGALSLGAEVLIDALLIALAAGYAAYLAKALPARKLPE